MSAEHSKNLRRGVANVTFIDPLDDDDYGLALAAADVLLVNEAGVANMAVPSKLTSFRCWTSGGGGDRSWWNHRSRGACRPSRVVVPAGDPESLLHAILDLGSDPGCGPLRK